MKTEQQQNEIEQTRRGGFGGSDAKLFYKVGLNGLSALNNTDKIRIAVTKGIREYKPIAKTAAMQRGHDFEDWYEKQPFAPLGAVREKKFSADLARNFDVFFHADFATENEIWELKCVQETYNAYSDYREQLQWQKLVSGIDNLWLVVCDSSQNFEDGMIFPELINRDEKTIETLLHGIKLIDENWDELDLTVGEDWSEADLLPFEKQDIQTFTNYLTEIKRLEAEAEERKEKVFEFMQANGIKTINSDFYSVSLVPESTTSTLDKSKLFREHPEINEKDYTKTSPKKAYLKVTLKLMTYAHLTTK